MNCFINATEASNVLPQGDFISSVCVFARRMMTTLLPEHKRYAIQQQQQQQDVSNTNSTTSSTATPTTTTTSNEAMVEDVVDDDDGDFDPLAPEQQQQQPSGTRRLKPLSPGVAEKAMESTTASTASTSSSTTSSTPQQPMVFDTNLCRMLDVLMSLYAREFTASMLSDQSHQHQQASPSSSSSLNDETLKAIGAIAHIFAQAQRSEKLYALQHLQTIFASVNKQSRVQVW